MNSDGNHNSAFFLTFREAAHLQAMEDNPLDDADLAMFEMFDREGWSDERRRAYILQDAKASAAVDAAE